MIPTYITVTLMLPGYGMTEENIDRASDNYSTALEYLENEARAVYSINRKAMVNIATEPPAVNLKDGTLAEPLLVFEDMREVGAFIEPVNGPWLEEFISQGSNESYDAANMEAIYKDVVELLKEARDKATTEDRIKANCKFWRFSFLAGWTIESSTDRDGHTDIDSIDYAGRMEAVSISAE